MSTCYLFHHLFDKNSIKFGRFFATMLFLYSLHFQLSIPCIGQKKYSYLIVLVLEYMF